MHPSRLLIATCRGLPGIWHDDEPLIPAFAARGIEAVPTPWQDIDPTTEHPILIRTPWDYAEHSEQFYAWLRALDAAGARVLNPASFLLWNLDKQYLLELASKGHPIVPTILHHFDGALKADVIAQLAAAERWGEVVCKPVVGAGARGLVVVNQAGDLQTFDASGNAWHEDQGEVPEGRVLVQPKLDMRAGEWSLFYFGGAFSHAILKRPAEGDLRVQEEHGGTTVAAEPPAAMLEVCAAIARELPDCLYARVDGVVAEDVGLPGHGFHLMELEAIEPELYFRTCPDAVDRFADVVQSWVQQAATTSRAT